MANNESISESISGTYVEAETRLENDRLLLNAIKSERDERMKYIREITEMLTTLEMNDVEIHDKLRKHEVALNFAIGLAVGLLFSMIVFVW